MSTLEVDKIIPQSGTNLQVGESGDTVDFSNATVTLPEGTGGLSYSAKTSDFNAVTGFAYIVDTTSGAVTATLPSSASIGNQIHFIDGSGTFDTYNLTINRNSHKIQGLAENLTVSNERAGFSLIYYNVANGWILKDV